MYQGWMKRIALALFVIGTVLCFSTVALAACSHSQTTTKTELAFEDKIDENYHYSHYSVYRVCTLCDERLETIETGYKGFPHTYDSTGRCTMGCSYDKVAPYLSASTTYIAAPAGGTSATINVSSNVKWYAYSSDEKWIWTAGSNGNGNGSFQVQITENKTGASRSGSIYVTAEGYKTISISVRQEAPACQHPQPKIEEGPRTDEGGGRWSQMITETCLACGNVKTYYRGGIYDTIPTPKPCDHKTHFDVTKEYYRPDDEETHTLYQEGKLICSSCSAVINPDYNSIEIGGSHTFNSNGKCTACGYQKPSCSHDETKKVFLRSEYDQISGNGQQHRVIDHNRVECAYCGQVLNNDKVDYWEDNHHFNTNNQCTDCGYQKITCVHEHTYKNYTFEGSCVRYDEEQHYRTRYYNRVCSKCKTIVDKNLKEKELEKHALIDDLGICMYCDDIIDIDNCTHWDVITLFLVKQNYENYNQIHHKVYGIATQTCGLCDAVLEENIESWGVEEHDFNQNAICINCGYKTMIDEDHSSFSLSTQTFYVPKSGETHTFSLDFSSYFEWTANSSVDWITVSARNGKKGAPFSYTVTENTGADRCGTIFVTVTDNKDPYGKYIIIIQEGSGEAKEEIHPTLSGFSVTPTTVTLGDSIAVSGTVNGNGAKLTAVSIGVRNYSNQALGGYWGHSTNLYADSFDLSSFGPLTLDGDLGNSAFESGQWIVEVYATTEDGLGFATSQAKIITVNNRKASAELPDSQLVEGQ